MSVLLATHNRAESLGRLLEVLHRQRVPPDLAWEVLVVQSACTDETARTTDAWRARLPLALLVEAAPGKCRALNRALDRARGELLVFTDDDVIPADDWLVTLVDAAARWPAHDIFAGAVVPRYPAGTPALFTCSPYAGVAFAHFVPEPTEGPSSRTPFGPNMAIRRSRIAGHRFRADLGPNGENYPIGGETEFLRRLVAAGAQIVHVPTAAVEHVVRPDQLCQRYLLTRARNFGRGLARLSPAAPSAPRLFGAPRYLWRELAGAHLRWFWSSLSPADPATRLRARWQLEIVRGTLQEARLGTRRP
ncbi:MAG: glycosyltransferase family 2 protein [Gemmatimonadales bacterium]